MNEHFQDTRYYLKRAYQTTKAGFGEELEPVRARVDALRGREEESESSRLDRMRARMQEMQARAREKFERVRRPRATQ